MVAEQVEIGKLPLQRWACAPAFRFFWLPKHGPFHITITHAMKTPADIRRTLLEIIEPVCFDSGYELVDVEYTTSPAGWIVRVYIDRRLDLPPSPKGGISFDDCESLSRQLSAVLDVEDPVPHAYSLEVSSPGLDRPLRTPAHFQRYLGETAKIMLAQPLDGRRNFKGILRALEPSAEDARTLLIDVEGVEFRLPLADIGSAHLVPDWGSLMKRGGGDAHRGSDQGRD
jgi:ribosome maturation factor RimP